MSEPHPNHEWTAANASDPTGHLDQAWPGCGRTTSKQVADESSRDHGVVYVQNEITGGGRLRSSAHSSGIAWIASRSRMA
jgi:hypothetical protein